MRFYIDSSEKQNYNIIKVIQEGIKNPHKFLFMSIILQNITNVNDRRKNNEHRKQHQKIP